MSAAETPTLFDIGACKCPWACSVHPTAEPPHARHTDPSSSHQAAEKFAVRAKTVDAGILMALRAAGPDGLNSHEIAEWTGYGLVTVSPRLKPLETAGFVRRLPEEKKRLNPRSGTHNTAWTVTPMGGQAVRDFPDWERWRVQAREALETLERIIPDDVSTDGVKAEAITSLRRLIEKGEADAGS